MKADTNYQKSSSCSRAPIIQKQEFSSSLILNIDLKWTHLISLIGFFQLLNKLLSTAICRVSSWSRLFKSSRSSLVGNYSLQKIAINLNLRVSLKFVSERQSTIEINKLTIYEHWAVIYLKHESSWFCLNTITNF